MQLSLFLINLDVGMNWSTTTTEYMKLGAKVGGQIAFEKKDNRNEIAKSVDLTLSLGGSGLNFFKEDLNMATINFSPLQNFKWL